MKRQGEIEGRESLSETPNDYAVVIDGPVVGRIHPNAVHSGKWDWALQSPTGAIGHADSLDEAKEELKKRWFAETKKLSQH
jgi:hypothetical protein